MSDDKLKAFMKKNLEKDQTLIFSQKKMQKMRSSAAPGEEIKGSVEIGPLGALGSIPDPKKQKLKIARKILRADKSLLPDAWRNDVVPTPKDDAEKEKYYKKVDLNPEKYKLATRPQAQKKCGSCFAFACATTISDAFVFGKNLKYNPLSSPLDILSCVNDDSNDKCDGGNPLGVLTYLAENKGITSSYCTSYDNWVEGNKLTSEAVPDCAGCYIKQCGDPKPKPNRYKIKPPTFISSSDATASDDSKIEGVGDSAIYEIKLHLLQYGSAVVGFPVLNNFLNDPDGSFHETNGIYFENKVYAAGGNDSSSSKGAESKKGDDPFVCAGGHAVCITGWGLSAKPITLYFPNDTDPNKKSITLEKCPYWVVRNSWGKEWGDGGYFKMGMYQKIIQDGVEYEINPNVAFERFRVYQAKMLDKKGDATTMEMPIGGVILIEPDEVVPDTQEPRDAPPYTNEEMKKFYCSDSELPPPPSSGESKPKTDPGPTPEKNNSQKSKIAKTNLSSSGDSAVSGSGNWGFLFFIFLMLILICGGIYYFKYYKKA